MLCLALISAMYKSGWRNKDSSSSQVGSDAGCLPSVMQKLISTRGCSGGRCPLLGLSLVLGASPGLCHAASTYWGKPLSLEKFGW